MLQRTERQRLALGDALGSNIVNIGLVAGIVLLMGMTTTAEISRRDAATALGMALLLLVLLAGGDVSRYDGLLLLATFAVWIVWTTRNALRDRSEIVETVGERRHGRSVAEAVVGLVCLTAAGRLLVVGAKGIGDDLGVSTFVIGVVLVSFGTSLPELATAIISRIRGHAELGVSTALGSNIFNTSFIVGVAAVLAPIEVAARETAVSIVAGVGLILVLLVGTRGEPLSRWRGVVLVGGYCLSLVALLVQQST